ncbi:hypothetical protein [Microbacterium gorillae]|uniref:hypothetical protein n=1 Tax=Microbacterium gorillae TaxID=1231063 RepID=UPI003D993550
MGTINTCFAAPDDATAAAAVDEGPVSFAPVLDAVEATVQGGTLFALLTEQSYEEAITDRSWARLITEPDHESAWIVSLPGEFWGGEDPAELLEMLREWRMLARTARERGENMYCRMSL